MELEFFPLKLFTLYCFFLLSSPSRLFCVFWQCGALGCGCPRLASLAESEPCPCHTNRLSALHPPGFAKLASEVSWTSLSVHLPKDTNEKGEFANPSANFLVSPCPHWPVCLNPLMRLQNFWFVKNLGSRCRARHARFAAGPELNNQRTALISHKMHRNILHHPHLNPFRNEENKKEKKKTRTR